MNPNTTTTNERRTVPIETIMKFARYYPEKESIWMYAMIVVGTAFIIFLWITMTIICKSTIRQWKVEHSNEMNRINLRNFGGSTITLRFDEDLSASRVNFDF